MNNVITVDGIQVIHVDCCFYDIQYKIEGGQLYVRRSGQEDTRNEFSAWQESTNINALVSGFDVSLGAEVVLSDGEQAHVNNLIEMSHPMIKDYAERIGKPLTGEYKPEPIDWSGTAFDDNEEQPTKKAKFKIQQVFSEDCVYRWDEKAPHNTVEWEVRTDGDNEHPAYDNMHVEELMAARVGAQCDVTDGDCSVGSGEFLVETNDDRVYLVLEA